MSLETFWKWLVFRFLGLFPVSWLRVFLLLTWPFTYLLLPLIPLRLSYQVRFAALLFNCGLLSQCASYWKKLLRGKMVHKLLPLNDQVIEVFEKTGAHNDLFQILLEASKNSPIPDICWTLFQQGEFESCKTLLDDSPQNNSNYKYYNPHLHFLNIVPISETFPNRNHRESVLPAQKVTFSRPRIFGEKYESSPYTLPIASLELFNLSDVAVFGANSIMSGDQLLVIDPAGNPSAGFVAGSWRYVTGSSKSKEMGLARLPLEKKVWVDSGILINGRCSFNYFHFLIEYLPRALALFASHQDHSDIPLLLEPRLPSQHFEAIDLIFGVNKAKVFHDASVTLQVGRLLVPSYHTFIPDQIEEPRWRGNGFSKSCTDFVRDRIGEKLGIDFSTGAERRELKVFLSRANISNRSISNQKSIEKVFQNNGYQIVFPELLSFREQVTLFANATHIAGPMGAAFANLIFCRPKTKVVGLISKQNSDWWFLPANLAAAYELDFEYLTGNPVKPEVICQTNAEFIHGPFSVAQEKVEAFLNQE